MEKRREILLNFAVAIGILLLFLHWIGWSKIFAAILAADPTFLIIGFTTGILVSVFWGLTWKVVLDASGHELPLFRLLETYYAGMFANNVTPLGQLGGEPFIAYILSQNSDMEYEKSLGAVVSADVLNTLPQFSFATLGLLLFVLFNPINPFILMIAGALFVTGVIALLLITTLFFRKDLAERIALRIGRVLDGIQKRLNLGHEISRGMLLRRVENFYETIDTIFAEKRDLVPLFFVSHAAWYLGILSLYTFLLAVGWKIDFLLLVLILPVSGLAFYLPLPGGLGGTEAFLTALLVFVGNVPAPIASAAVILQRASTYGVNLLVGGVSITHLSVNLDDMDEVGDEVREEVDEDDVSMA